MKLPPNPTDEEMAYAEKWSYVIQLRYTILQSVTYHTSTNTPYIDIVTYISSSFGAPANLLSRRIAYCVIIMNL